MTPQDWKHSIEQIVESWLAQTPLKDLSDNAKTFLVGALQKLDVVTREEYEIQVAVLARTREKLNELEAQVAQLEQHLNQ